MHLDNHEDYGLTSPIGIVQSLEQRKVVIIGTRYAGEIKKSIFYAMNFDLPAMGADPLHKDLFIELDRMRNVPWFDSSIAAPCMPSAMAASTVSLGTAS